MKVSYDEDLASYIGPESCVHARKGVREALTGERAGWVLSHESKFTSGCRRCQCDRKAIWNVSLSQETFRPCEVVDPMHARKLFAREPGDPMSGLGRWRQGPRCESQGNTTAMYGYGKSDRPIVTEEAAEQRRVEFPLAEAVEGRGLTKGNLFRQNKFWTQDQEGIGHAG